MKGEAPPRLKDVVEIVAQELIGSSIDVALQHHNIQFQRILEGLVSHFFSTHLLVYNAKDIQSFLELANKNIQWNVEQAQTVDNKTFCVDEYDHEGCISMSVFKYYLTKILDKADISSVGTTAMTTLTLYKPWVCKLFCLTYY